MIYYLEVRDHRPIDVELRKSNVDSKYADIVITIPGLKEIGRASCRERV